MTRQILIVDDNFELAENLRELLELEGFDATVSVSAAEALEPLQILSEASRDRS
jgi:CheY-like chemotaxis protein